MLRSMTWNMKMPDNRDPQAIGEMMLKLRKGNSKAKFHELADMIENLEVKAFEDKRPDRTKYQRELKRRAEEGDPYAISILAAQDGNL
jgi:hypothetical protein